MFQLIPFVTTTALDTELIVYIYKNVFQENKNTTCFQEESGTPYQNITNLRSEAVFRDCINALFATHCYKGAPNVKLQRHCCFF